MSTVTTEFVTAITFATQSPEYEVEEDKVDSYEQLILFVGAPSFFTFVVIAAIVIAYLMCRYSKVEMSRPDSNSTVEVEGQVMMTTSVDMSSSSGDISELPHQGHGNILIDEYGIPEDPSHSSSEIMARLAPPLDHNREGFDQGRAQGRAQSNSAQWPDPLSAIRAPRQQHLVSNPGASGSSSSSRNSMERTNVKRSHSGSAYPDPPIMVSHRSGSGSPRNRSNPSKGSKSKTSRSGSNPRKPKTPRSGSNPRKPKTPRSGSNPRKPKTPRSGSNPRKNRSGSQKYRHRTRSGSGSPRNGSQRPRRASRSGEQAAAAAAIAPSPKSSKSSKSLNARKQEWVRVMMEHNVDRTKAEELARDHSCVEELAESVENGTLSDGALASRLHHCDAAFDNKAVMPYSMSPSRASKASRALSAGVALIPQSSMGIQAHSVLLSSKRGASKASNLALREAPVLHDNVAKGQCGHDTYKEICLYGKGGFGEIYQGYSDRTGAVFALKRQMVVQESDANVHDGRQLLQLQLKRMGGIMRETRIYFSSTLNISTSRHLARIHDVVLVRNSAGNDEPLLVFEYADAPKYNTLSAWMKHYTKIGSKRDDIKMRLSFAIQMFSGLTELHYGSEADRLHEQQQWEEVLTRSSESRPPAMSKLLAKTIVDGKTNIHEVMAALRTHYTDGEVPREIVRELQAVPVQPLYAHQDMKGANMLLFGQGSKTRLALTDFGLTVQYNNMHARPIYGGTLKYMAPEQWEQKTALTPKRDIWSAGLILAQLFGGVKTKAKLKEYQVFCAKVNENFLAQYTRSLVKQARAIIDAMEDDATQFSWRNELSGLLQRCFGNEVDRFTAIECKDALVDIWTGLYPSTPWKEFESALKPPKVAPCAAEWNRYDRKAMSYSICRHMVNLMSERCEEAAKIASPELGNMIRHAQKNLSNQLNNITARELSYSAKSRQARWDADADNK